MATVKRYLLTCDAGTERAARSPHCYGLIGYETTAKAIERESQQHGWIRTVAGDDLCPACAKANSSEEIR